MNIPKEMGLTSSKNDPCLFYGIIDDGTSLTTLRHPIHIGLYVENFVLFSELDA